MKYFIKTGRIFYAIALLVYGAQHFYFGTFRDVFVSRYQNHLPVLSVWAYLFGLYLVVSGILIIAEKRGKACCLLLGSVLLGLCVGTQITYQLFSEPNKIYHLGLWVNPLKEIALAGGAFVVAASFKDDKTTSKLLISLERIAPYGNLFFLFTMTAFGIGHLMYVQYLEKILPAWIPDHVFWVYFSGVALIASGAAIILGIRIRVVALLLAIMLFSWFWMMHLPPALRHPWVDRGNLIASSFDALAFSGTALLIAFTTKQQKWVTDLENWNKHYLSHEKNL
jgi:uncharacterized membrane protein YphA (DoxX/SURF4 family)